MIDEEGLRLNRCIWDEIMAGYLVGGNPERGKRGESEGYHCGPVGK